MKGYHCTTPTKLERYRATGAILPPVRFWAYDDSARAWCGRTQRSIVLEIEVVDAHPLPDHKPAGHAYWSRDVVRAWREL